MSKELKTEVVGIRLTKDVKEFLTSKADADDRALSNLIQIIIKKYVSERMADG